MQKVTDNMKNAMKKPKLDQILAHNHDLRQRHMVESNNSKRRSDDHLQFLEHMIESGEALEKEILAEIANDQLSKAESASVIGG